jgi:excisionase family DNA binding protein
MSRLETSPRPGRAAVADAGDAGERLVGGSLLSAAEVAEMLGVPVSWVYEQSRRGRIPTVTLGRYRRYRRGSIEAWLEQLEGASMTRAVGRRPR